MMTKDLFFQINPLQETQVLSFPLQCGEQRSLVYVCSGFPCHFWNICLLGEQNGPNLYIFQYDHPLSHKKMETESL